MTLGEKIKQARLEAGLSQRQLCGEEVTRNMLSQIENGAAKPSMATLSYFAARLGKTVSYFLEEDAVLSPNLAVIARAREAIFKGDGQVLQILSDYRGPDATFDLEFQLLSRLGALGAAREAVQKGQNPYAAEILEHLDVLQDGYCADSLEKQRLLLLATVRPQLRHEICTKLPSIDEELLLRARDALDRGELDRSEHLLEAAQDHNGADWNFLRGEVHLVRQQFAAAAVCYHKAEAYHSKKCAIRLERCYRELEDFKKAYEYACKVREL
jgi:transcriptional regulator with XRE-family HTH domain